MKYQLFHIGTLPCGLGLLSILSYSSRFYFNIINSSNAINSTQQYYKNKLSNDLRFSISPEIGSIYRDIFIENYFQSFDDERLLEEFAKKNIIFISIDITLKNYDKNLIHIFNILKKRGASKLKTVLLLIGYSAVIDRFKSALGSLDKGEIKNNLTYFVRCNTNAIFSYPENRYDKCIINVNDEASAYFEIEKSGNKQTLEAIEGALSIVKKTTFTSPITYFEEILLKPIYFFRLFLSIFCCKHREPFLKDYLKHKSSRLIAYEISKELQLLFDLPIKSQALIDRELSSIRQFGGAISAIFPWVTNQELMLEFNYHLYCDFEPRIFDYTNNKENVETLTWIPKALEILKDFDKDYKRKHRR